MTLDNTPQRSKLRVAGSKPVSRSTSTKNKEIVPNSIPNKEGKNTKKYKRSGRFTLPLLSQQLSHINPRQSPFM